MVLHFNERRAPEAAAKFLELCGGQMNWLKLIKLLYSARCASCSRRHSAWICVHGRVIALIAGDFMKPGGAMMPPHRLGATTQFESSAFGWTTARRLTTPDRQSVIATAG